MDSGKTHRTKLCISPWNLYIEPLTTITILKRVLLKNPKVNTLVGKDVKRVFILPV